MLEKIHTLLGLTHTDGVRIEGGERRENRGDEHRQEGRRVRRGDEGED